MPQISASGTPMAWKKTSTSRGVGAAPTLTSFAWSSPIAARSGANSFSSASASTRLQRVRDRLPGLLELHPLAGPAASSFCASSSPASLASTPALSFSHTRGTAKNHVGLTAGRNSPIRRGSGQVVIVIP